MKAAHNMAICRCQKQEGAFQSNGGAIAPLILFVAPRPHNCAFRPEPDFIRVEDILRHQMPGFCFSNKRKKKLSTTFRLLNVSSKQFIRTVAGHRSGNRAGAEE